MPTPEEAKRTHAVDASVARVSCELVDDGTSARLVVDVDNFQRAAA
jgi:hypothetical protein